MKKDRKERGNVPNLRFPEFHGEWEETEIKNILKIGNGRDYKHLERGNIPVLGTGGYMTSVNDFLYDGESVCIGRKGTINKPFYLTGKFWTVDTLFYTYSYKNILPKFLFYIFEQINWIKYNEASGVPSLSKNTIEKIPIVIPKKEEQNKIATFLSLIDERIETQNKIIEDLKLLKDTISKKIFLRQLIFKDGNGNDYPEWESEKLGEVLEIQGGYAFKSSSFNQGNTKVIRIGDIKPRIKLQFFLGVYSHEIPNEKYIVKKNDFVMALSGATFGKVGKISDDGIAYINQRVALFKTEQCLEFFYQLILIENFKNYIASIPTASAQPNISNNDIANYRTAIPCIAEQQKIATFLSSIDSKIDIETLISRKLEEQKKFLLEQMFV